ncbi:uncharacterized protein Z519_10101 [Cladophialophora bantiana CBS 173.52]|uniref:Oxidoreductase n=1 Tax=Cladophialophora bantiana (strain ATCC 10958 / CBS 173.52 / CDC B-1940 / NIH 8579) TaxID=1442370 RepID=A0A0D2H7G1_CLAB1|nr:uncharacterized protein Z519_10101 [Cladophialophora bantiana CBS 173.52]KIW89248.1 hypothetical protein Z519_10101 [Cladophialophora bantiana CBS 173.52]
MVQGMLARSYMIRESPFGQTKASEGPWLEMEVFPRRDIGVGGIFALCAEIYFDQISLQSTLAKQVRKTVSPVPVAVMLQSKFSPDSLPVLNGKVFLVTGGNTGIGLSTVAGLASRGATVYMGARDESKARAAIQEIVKEHPNANIHIFRMDLTSLDNVVEAAREFFRRETRLHGLVNNAGIMGVPFSMTNDGYVIQFQTNYLSHWLLTYHLLPLMIATASSAEPGAVRIVNVTSDGHALFVPRKGIDFDDISLESSSSMTRYGQSKLANILHVKALHKKYGPEREDKGGPEIWVAAVHPGHIYTNLSKQATATAPATVLHTVAPIMRFVGVLHDRSKGALSSLFAIASPDFNRSDSGAYVVPYAKIGIPSDLARDDLLIEKLWSWSFEELKKKGKLDRLEPPNSVSIEG